MITHQTSLASNLKLSVKTFFPVDCEDILKNRNEYNRVEKPNKSVKYSKSMKEDKWRLNGESIVFDWNGQLVSGQHRFRGCIISKTPFTSIVVEGVAPDVRTTNDTGTIRSAGDHLSTKHIPNNAIVASSLQWVLKMENSSQFSKTAYSNEEIDEALSRHPDIINSATWGHKTKKVIPNSLAGAFHYLFSRKDLKLADEMFQKIATGEGLTAQDPVHRLRERMIQEKASKSPLPVPEVAVLVVRTWNALRDRRLLKSLKGSVKGASGELIFPDIV